MRVLVVLIVLFCSNSVFSQELIIDSLIRKTPFYSIIYESDSMQCFNLNYSIKGILEGKYKKTECYYQGTPLVKSLEYTKYRGKYDGVFKKWNSKGQLVKVDYYDEGCLNGISLSAYDNGVLSSRGIYTESCIDTIIVDTRSLEESDEPLYSSIRERKKVKIPFKDKKWEYFSREGMLVHEEIWEKGKLISTKEFD